MQHHKSRCQDSISECLSTGLSTHQSHDLPPEAIVGLGFRLWYSGCNSGQLVLWEKAWQLYVKALGVQRAQAATNELARWVTSVARNTTREIRIFPHDASYFCRDECLAISMIASCQHNACPALKACAFALIENAFVDNVVMHSERMANVLTDSGVVVPSPCIINAANFIDGEQDQLIH